MSDPLAPVHSVGGSPLYDVAAAHGAAVAALVVLAALVWWRRAAFARLAPSAALLAVLLLASSAVHLGLAAGHDTHAAGTRLLFLLDAALLAAVARRVVRGADAGRAGALVLAGSVVAYALSSLGGEPPDQLGLATKLGEILALAIVLTPARRGAARRSAAASAAIVVLVVVTAASAWIGAFRAAAAEPGAVAGHHVHGGRVAPPGTLLPSVPDREPTREERAAAEALVLEARAALAKYADPSVAAADGYRVAGMHGIDFHASNPGHENDGRVLDPARPEALVYAVAPDGRPVLLGALFQMPGIGVPGPAVGGPLTVWHGHEHVCFTLAPPFLAGLLGPFGTCPLGSLDIPKTSEMIHVWTVPGAPQPFGDLDDAWKRAHLRAVASGR